MHWKKQAVSLLAGMLGVAAFGGQRLPAQELARNNFNSGYPAQRLNLMVNASDLMGTMVWDREGHRLGRIQDFLVDKDSWRVLCALVRPVNLYGPKEYFVGVPARCFTVAETGRAVVDATVTNFIGLPRFQADASRDATAMSASLKQLFEQFGQKIYWDEKKGLDRLVRCEVWRGMGVDDQGGVNVGTLSDFLIDLPGERVVFAKVAFFGLDENEHVIPPGAFSVAPGKASLALRMDAEKKSALLNSDEFMWTKLADPAWVASVYQAYGEKINFEAPPSLEEARAKSREPLKELSTEEVVPTSMPGVTLAPNPVAGGNLPQAIMTEFIQEDLANLGAAQNVKVTVSDGNVTLTGRVDNERQGRDLIRIAEHLAGAGKVTNRLEVK